MKIEASITSLIGNTPLLELCKIEKDFSLNAKILAKIEGMNPGGSAKDRVALQMISDGERSGKLKQGGTVIEPTSGNTGIGLAAICAARGYRAIFTMPENMSVERQKLLRAYGAEVILTPKQKGMAGAVEEAKRLNHQIPGSFLPDQFSNPSNSLAHYLTTGKEIWEDTDGTVHAFVASVGTGGTLTGVGRFLKEKNPSLSLVAVEPKDSPVLSGGKPAAHKIQGIGAGFIPEVLDTTLYDQVQTVSWEDAYRLARLVAKKEGLLIGISSGAALCAAIEVAKREEMAGKTVVVLFPDSGERYLSTDLYESDSI